MSDLRVYGCMFFQLAIQLRLGERKLGRLVDALALGGDEGRDKLR